jgi:hypothetical protein
VKVKGENPPPESSFIDMKMNPLTCIRFEHIPRDWGTNEEIYPPPLGVMGPNAAEIIAQRAHDRQVNYGKVYILHRGLDTECAITVEIKGILVVDDAA